MNCIILSWLISCLCFLLLLIRANRSLFISLLLSWCIRISIINLSIIIPVICLSSHSWLVVIIIEILLLVDILIALLLRRVVLLRNWSWVSTLISTRAISIVIVVIILIVIITILSHSRRRDNTLLLPYFIGWTIILEIIIITSNFKPFVFIVFALNPVVAWISPMILSSHCSWRTHWGSIIWLPS